MNEQIRKEQGLSQGETGWDNMLEPSTGEQAETTTEITKKKNIMRAMELLHADTTFRTPEKSKEFLNELDFDSFKRFLEFTNNMVRELKQGEKQKVGESVSWVQSSSIMTGDTIEYRPPRKKYREQLLKFAFDKAQQLEAPDAAGLTLAFAINAIHPFDDGNGRTARMIYALSEHGFNGSDKDKELYNDLFENQNGRKVVNPNPARFNLDYLLLGEMTETAAKKKHYEQIPQYVYGGYGDGFAGEHEASDLPLNASITKESRDKLHAVLEDEKFSIPSIIATFDYERVKDFIAHREKNEELRLSEATYLRGDVFVESLSEEEISHLYHSWVVTKVAYVKKLINFSDRKDATAILEAYRENSKLSGFTSEA